MKRSIAGAALLAASTLAAAAQAQQPPDTVAKQTRPRSAYEDMQMFSQVLNTIRVNHPDSIDTHDLMMAAIEGMVHAADPHSFVVRVTTRDSDKERAERDGKLYEVPLVFTYIDEAPVVWRVVPGTDAAQLDILPGDELIAVDGKPLISENEEELRMELAGMSKSPVRLTLERRRIDGSLVTLEREVRREKPGREESPVPVAFMLDGQTGYVRITTFIGEHIAEDLHDAIARLEKKGMQRLVLDLRDNGGGRIDEAAKVAGEFLPSGALVWTSEGRKAEITDTGRVQRSFWKSERRFPVVLMINEGTASASELVAGALQDHDRALIVGQPSFGKALLMYGFPLTEHSYIELVVGHVKTPCGRVIQRRYHAVARRDYYRMAVADRDTAGRPWCRTDAGRVVYGGGGIYPDILFRRVRLVPYWLMLVRENSFALKWLGGYVSAGGAFPSLDSLAAHPRVPPSAIGQFREFIAKDSIAVPPGPEADSLLNGLLVRGIARLKWGDEGYYRLYAVLDGDVALAQAAFDRAQAILGPAR